jgi:hypothetical protein
MDWKHRNDRSNGQNEMKAAMAIHVW